MTDVTGSEMDVDIEHLRRWKEEATEVLTGMQALGKALGLPLGARITGVLAAEIAGELRVRTETAEAKVARVEALLASETADAIEGRVRAARDDVRCLDCNLRYGERQEYGCHWSGQAHSYSKSDLAAAEEIERSGSVEYVTLAVADLNAALAESKTKASERALRTLADREVSDLRAVHSAGSSRQLLNLVERIIRDRAEAGR